MARLYGGIRPKASSSVLGGWQQGLTGLRRNLDRATPQPVQGHCRQWFFSISLQHLRRQGEASLRAERDVENDAFTLHSACPDRHSANANRSAVGVHIPFEPYLEAMEQSTPAELLGLYAAVAQIPGGVDPELMQAMEVAQAVGRVGLEDRMARIAADFGLNYGHAWGAVAHP
jgi:hypothetical protein